MGFLSLAGGCLRADGMDFRVSGRSIANECRPIVSFRKMPFLCLRCDLEETCGWGRLPGGAGGAEGVIMERGRTYCAAMPYAARCDGRCSALRRPMHRIALAVSFKRNCRQGMLLRGMERGEPSVAAAIHSAKGASAFFAQCLSLAPEACQIVVVVTLCHQFATHRAGAGGGLE